MNKQTKQLQDTLRLVGITVRTEGKKAPQDVGALWARAGQEGRLPHDGSPVYGAYFNYAGDENDAYDAFVGKPSDAPLKEGEVELSVPKGDYFVVETQGQVPQVVQQAWHFVHHDWDQAKERKYKIDFERYVGNPAECAVELWVGLS